MIQRLRVSVLILVHVLILLHIYYFKDGVIGSIDFQEFFHSFLKLGVINSGVILVIFSFFITFFDEHNENSYFFRCNRTETISSESSFI